MSQEYTEDKEVSLTPMSSGRRLLEALLLLIGLFAAYLMLSLLSFDPSDPSWSQTAWHEPIHNWGGGLGAWLADTLLFIFGVMAYAIPAVILGLCWAIYKYPTTSPYPDYFAIGLRLIGVLALVITTCGLAAINADDIWYFASGGVIGSLVSTSMAPWFTSLGGTLTLLVIWAAGVTLYTGWSWLTIAEKLGSLVMAILTFASNRGRDESRWPQEPSELASEEASSQHSYPESDDKPLLTRGRNLFRRRRQPPHSSEPEAEEADALLAANTVNGNSAQADDYDLLLDYARPVTPLLAASAAELAANSQASGASTTHAAAQPQAEAYQSAAQPAASPAAVNPQLAPGVAAQPQAEAYQSAAQPAASSATVNPQPAPGVAAQPQAEAYQSAAHPAASSAAVNAQSLAEAYQAVAQPTTSSASYGVQPVPGAAHVVDHGALTQPQQPAEAGLTEAPESAPQPSQGMSATTFDAASSAAAITSAAGVAQASAAAGAGQSPFAMAADLGKLNQASAARQSPNANPQVKQGSGPELPRPNPVRIPTRRELSSYGIKLPSHEAEQKARLQHQAVEPESEATAADAAELAEQARLRQQYEQQQSQRYGQSATLDGGAAEQAAELAEQARLHQQYEQQQSQRYGQSTTLDGGAAEQAAELAEQARLRQQYEQQQSQRYGQSTTVDGGATEQAAELAEQARLRQQYEQQQSQRYGPSATVDGGAAEQAAEQAEQARLRQQYEQQQSQRYGQSATVDGGAAEQAAELAEQARLRHQYEQQQSQRYGQSATLDGGATEQAAELAEQARLRQQYEQQQSQGDAEPQAASEQFTSADSAANAAPSAADPNLGSQQQTAQNDFHDSLFHPFLVRHEQPLQKPTTPLPTLDLLTEPPLEEEPVDMFALEQTGQLVETRLNDFRVKAEVVGISPGPVITRFELDLAPGVKAARISSLSRDLARSLSAVAVRVVEVIPGKPYVGLELPNKHRQTVYLREVLDCPQFRDDPSPLTVVLGKDISGEPVVADLAKMPHLLVAGTTGSGKSVGVNAMILSMLYKATPEEVRFIMIDPKMLELSIYEGIPHLLTEVVTDMKDAANALRWCVAEMERRYKLMSALGVRNLAGYNAKMEAAEQMGRPVPDPFWKPGESMDSTPPVLEKLPYIVVMVDEFADLMMAVGKKVEELIARLAQKARAAGIHLVLATQRPSVDVITGLIKANIPTRIAFTVSSKIDSRTILDQGGAESLLGMGDMLYVPPNSSMPVRVHGAFVRDQEVHAVVQDWKARGRPQYIDSITAGDESETSAGPDGSGEELDPLFDQAVAFVVEKRRASISGVQRQFRIGYNRAARIVEQMEAQGIVSEPGHNGNREVLSPPPHEL